MSIKRKGRRISPERYSEKAVSRRQFLAGTGIVVGGAALGVMGMLSACRGEEPTAPAADVGALPTFPAPSVYQPAQQIAPLKLLKTSPERGPVGTSVTLTGEGLPPGKTADIVWATVDGSYKASESKTGVTLGVQYDGRAFTPKRVSLGRATIGSDGSVTATFTAPTDYGEVHDVYLAVDGEDVAKGGFRLMRSFTMMSPTSGPVGTVITIKATELGWKPFESTVALLYDNKFMGFASATTTRGTAEFQIRAAGPVGKHYISVHPASHAAPFLNIKTGATSTRHLLPLEEVFTVTRDDGPPPARVEFPDPARVATIDGKNIPSMGEMVTTPGVSASLSPTSGAVLTKATLKASGLSPGSADIVWVTSRRSDPLAEIRIEAIYQVILGSNITVGQSGSIDAPITVPDGVGGWHIVKVMQNNKAVVEVPFYVEQSLFTPLPVRVKAGEKFTVWFKGGGWTELDNGAAVVYDNAYIGYVCGYAFDGTTPVELVATGGRGTHLLDIYPYIFDGGHGDWPWQYNFAQLTALKDHPGLGLGYKFPIYRIAIEIV